MPKHKNMFHSNMAKNYTLNKFPAEARSENTPLIGYELKEYCKHQVQF